MPLDFQISQAPMRLGLAEGVEPHQTPLGTLTKAENACWTKTGLQQKRCGTQALAKSIVGGGAIASGKRLFVRGDELAMTDGASLYAYTSAGWASRGRIPGVGIEWSVARSSLSTVWCSDVAAAGNAIVEAWIEGDLTSSQAATNTLSYRVTDASTGTLITPVTTMSFAVRTHIRVLASGSFWIILAVDSLGQLRCITSGGASVVLATDAAITANNALDAVVLGTDFVVAYTRDAGDIRLIRSPMSGTPSVVASGTSSASGGISSISIAGTAGGSLFIAYSQLGGASRVQCAVHNATTLANTVAAVTATSTTTMVSATVTAVMVDATTAALVFSFVSSVYQAGALKVLTVSSAGAVSLAAFATITGLVLLSKPAIIDGRFYAAVANARSEYTAGGIGVSTDVMLLDVTPDALVAGSNAPRQVGKVNVFDGAYWTPGYAAASSAMTSGLVVHTPAQAEGVAGFVGLQSIVSATRVVLRPLANVQTDMWRSVSLGPELCFAAGMLSAYDGAEATGYGWAYGPLIDKANTAVSATGGVLEAGNYLYNVVAERRSATGLLYRSPAGIAQTYTTTGTTSSITIGVVAPALGHTNATRGGFVFYRSVKNSPIPQRIGFPPNYMTVGDGNLGWPNTVTDIAADAAITIQGIPLAARPALYIQGGELEDVQPPSALTLAYHQNRIWMVAGDRRTVWFSKDRNADPTIAPGFHPDTTIGFDRDLVALAVLDDKLIAFAENTLWMIVGQGPAPNGENGTYEVVPVQTDVGCTNPRSVVSTPDGIMFQSERGLYLLTRALELQWIGRPVADEIEAHPDVTSAVLVAGRNEIRFTASGAELAGTRSIVLVYNYVERQWTTSRYTADAVYGAELVDACMWQGQWTALTAAGTVLRETTAGSKDTNADGVASWVPMTVETAWLNAIGPLSFQSVRNFSFEGVARSPHSLTIEVGFDSEDSYPQTRTFNVVDLGPESFEISIGTRRKCHAIRFRLTDAAPTGEGVNTGEGLSLAMLGIEVGQKRGFAKKPAQRTG